MALSRRVVGALLASLAMMAATVCEAQVSIEDAVINIVESSGQASTSKAVVFPASTGRLRLDHTQTLKVELKVVLREDGSSVRPQQVFLRVTAPSGDAAYFAALKNKDGALAVSATPAGVAKQIGTQGGEYSAALLLGGTNLDAPVEWEVASLEVLHPPQDDGTQPRSEPLHATAALFAPKTEIVHMHRPAEKRAAAPISLLFTGLTCVPLAALLLALGRLGANTKGLPQSGPGVLWALGFHAGLAAIMAAFLLFWLKFNLLQLLPWLGVLALGTWFFGSKLLTSTAAARRKQE